MSVILKWKFLFDQSAAEDMYHVVSQPLLTFEEGMIPIWSPAFTFLSLRGALPGALQKSYKAATTVGEIQSTSV